MRWGRIPTGERYLFDIDIDAQDEQNERLLREKLAPEMFAGEFADTQDYRLAVS